MKKIDWSEYLVFSRNERVALIVLMFLILFFAFLPGFIPQTANLDYPRVDSSWLTEDTPSRENHPQERHLNYQKTWGTKPVKSDYDIHPFLFDPNTLDEQGWQKLGLPPRLVSTILKFRSRGGKFFNPEDLRKIFGMTEDVYSRLSPFVRIQKKSGISTPPIPNQPRENYPTLLIDLNSADTMELKKLPGIGSKLSQRIVLFRDKLGGFYHINQLAEVYGLKDSVLNLIKPYLILKGEVRKIRINSATIEKLKIHPCFGAGTAVSIIAYRKEHDEIRTVEDLKKIRSISESQLQRMLPYINFDR